MSITNYNKKACPEPFSFTQDKLSRRVFIRTFGCQMETALHTDFTFLGGGL